MKLLKLSQKKTCMGCRALLRGQDAMLDTQCQLGYKIEFEMMTKISFRPVPMAPCYKPMSNRSLIEASCLMEQERGTR